MKNQQLKSQQLQESVIIHCVKITCKWFGSFTKAVLVLSLMCLSIHAFADKDIIIDHEEQTITIRANFITFAPIKLTLYDAADLWNEQSEKFLYEVKAGDSVLYYTVYFHLMVNEDPANDVAMNVVTVIPCQHKLCKKRKRMNQPNTKNIMDQPAGITDGKSIAINERFRNNPYVLAHEMGHALGLTHSEGLMYTHLGDYNITVFNVIESLAQLQETFIEKKQSLRKKIEFGIAPDQLNYVRVIPNESLLVS